MTLESRRRWLRRQRRVNGIRRVSSSRSVVAVALTLIVVAIGAAAGMR
ncbi:MAG: hypothetical protein ACHQ0J_11855 [Candidatus Dormibacterales bacterium]